VLDVVVDDQLVEGSDVAGAKCIEEPAHDLFVALGLSHVFLHCGYSTDADTLLGAGEIKPRGRFGGLTHEYHRAAA
jgi:hypothetical protein